MNNQEPLVSVIICTYNYGHFIREAVQSALDQDYVQKNVWVIDDASTDDTWEVIDRLPELEICLQKPDLIFRENEIDKFEMKYLVPGVILYYIRLKTNAGPSRARNIGIVNALASGAQFIQVLDADDMMRPNKVSELVKAIMIDPQNIGAAYADYTIWDINKNTYTYESKEPYDIQRLYQDCIVHSGAMINCLALQRVAFSYQGKNYPCFYLEELRTCEDYNLILRISKHFLTYHIAKDLTLVRNQSNNSTLTVDKERWERDYMAAKQHALSQ